MSYHQLSNHECVKCGSHKQHNTPSVGRHIIKPMLQVCAGLKAIHAKIVPKGCEGGIASSVVIDSPARGRQLLQSNAKRQVRIIFETRDGMVQARQHLHAEVETAGRDSRCGTAFSREDWTE